MIQVLNEFARGVRLCSHTKRWWSEDIKEARKRVGKARRVWKKHRKEEDYAKYKRRNELVDAIRKARREHWTNFLQDASRDNLWTAIRYTKPGRSGLITDIIQPDQSVASTSREKAMAFISISFLGERQQPTTDLDDCTDSELEEEEEDITPDQTAVQWIEDNDQIIEQTIKAQKSNKAPGVDRMGAPVIRLLWSWARERIHRLFIECIRGGIHCSIWRKARRVMIPKPGREDLSDCKSYRCISLLSCLGKVLEKVVCGLLERQLYGSGLIDPAQHESLRGGSAVDAVATLVSLVEEAWSKKRIAGAVCMDVRAAFPSVNAEVLARGLLRGGVERCLVSWV